MSYVRELWQSYRRELQAEIAAGPTTSQTSAAEYLLSQVELVLACPDHRAVEAAYRLGLARGGQETMTDAVFQTGLKRTRGLRHWHEAAHGTRGEKQERWAAIVASVERHAPTVAKRTLAYLAAAQECGVSLSTVERAMRRKRAKKSSVSRQLPED